MSSPRPLDTIMRRAGAVISDGSGVAAHFGSPAAELAVCVRTVGLADRSDIGKLALTGSVAGVDALVRRAIGAALVSGGVSASAGAWWCADSPERVLVLCEPAQRARLLDVLRAQSYRLPGVDVTDASTTLSALAVVGRAATSVLSALGALGPKDDPRSAPPFGRRRIAGAEVCVLLQSDRRAVVLVEPADADRVWRAAEQAGRPFGLSCVGRDAVERFSLLDRMTLRVPAASPR